MSLTSPDSRRPTTFDYRLRWWLFQPYKWLVAALFLGVSTFVFGVLSVLVAMVSTPRVGGKVAALWGRLNAWVGAMFVSVAGRENVDPKQSYVIVANHQSLYDILIVYGWLGIDFRWVMKQELRKVPVLGYTCEKLEHIYIDRSNPRSTVKSLNAAKTKIVDGTSIFFFPEGERSKSKQLLPFKSGAFRMATALKLPILPITITGTGDLVPPGTMDLMPGKAKLIIHAPIPVTAYKTMKAPELADLAFERIAAGLAEN